MSKENGDKSRDDPERRAGEAAEGGANGRGGSPAGEREILDIDEAAELLGVSVKTFNKVLHSENLPARKVGREWKFSRRALIEWVGSGRSREFYRESVAAEERETVVQPHERPGERAQGEKPRGRRTAGWQIEMD